MRRLHQYHVHSVVICSLFCLSLSLAVQAQERIREFRYAIIHIPGIGGGSDMAFGMNDHGQIVGEALTPDHTAYHALIWDGKSTKDLGTLGGRNSAANAINNKGWVVGAAYDGRGSSYHAFVWRGQGELIALPELDFARSSTAWAINNTNQIAGSSDTPEATIGHAVLWTDPNNIVDLGTLEGFGDSTAHDITDEGHVAGYSTTSNGIHGFIWHGNKMNDIGALGSGVQRTEVQAMNDSHIVVGWGNVNDNNKRRPCVYFQGEWHNMIRPITDMGFDRGTSWDINNDNQIVGEIHHEGVDDFFGFIAQAGDGIQILNDLVPPYNNWNIKSARAINEHGQIAANALSRTTPGGSNMLLLTPIEPELTLEIADGPLQADAINTLKITGAQAGATIKFFYGKRGGGKRIPGCDALAAMTQIDDPVLFGEAIADADGNAALDIYIPPHGAVHWGFLLQAVDFENCEESQLLLKKVD